MRWTQLYLFFCWDNSFSNDFVDNEDDQYINMRKWNKALRCCLIFFFSFIKLKKNLKQTLTNIKKFFLSQTIKCTLIFSSWFFNHQKDYLIKKFAVKNIYCSIHYLFIYSLLWNCIAPLLKLNKLLKIYFYLMHSPWKNRGLNYNKLTQKWWALTWSFYICDFFNLFPWTARVINWCCQSSRMFRE